MEMKLVSDQIIHDQEIIERLMAFTVIEVCGIDTSTSVVTTVIHFSGHTYMACIIADNRLAYMPSLKLH